jgi:hypothetical protein
MPFPFLLPTTSYLNFSEFLSSSTHPSLPPTATWARAVLRDALKKHKRLPASSQSSHLPTVVSALDGYLPYLSALDAGLSSSLVAGEEVDLALLKEIEVEWRCTLSKAQVPGRDPPRAKLRSFEAEYFFTCQTLAFAHSLLARVQLRPLYANDAAPLSDDQRKVAVATAMQHLLTANSIHGYLVQRASMAAKASPAQVADISLPVLSALTSLAMAEATLITVLKDDPYPNAVVEGRNKHSKDWMFKAPDMPQVRAHLFARLCLAAAEHASRGLAGVRNARGIDEDLGRYLDDLRRTARAKAARFLGIDADREGRGGEGIAWIRGAMKELGTGGEDGGSAGGLAKLKRNWKEKMEDRRVAKGGAEWGADAGRLEEGRVLEMLEKKWVKQNDTVNFGILARCMRGVLTFVPTDECPTDTTL